MMNRASYVHTKDSQNCAAPCAGTHLVKKAPVVSSADGRGQEALHHQSIVENNLHEDILT